MLRALVALHMLKGLLPSLALWNGGVFLLFGLDKLFAIRRRRRVSEITLLLCAFLLGGVGGLLGMLVFRHKIRRRRFRLLLPAACAITLLLLFYPLLFP